MWQHGNYSLSGNNLHQYRNMDKNLRVKTWLATCFVTKLIKVSATLVDTNFTDTSKGTTVSMVTASSWKTTEQKRGKPDGKKVEFYHFNRRSSAWTMDRVLVYLMTFTDNRSSFHGGIYAVGHMEQEDPWSRRCTLHIYTCLQLETNTHTHIDTLLLFTVGKLNVPQSHSNLCYYLNYI